MGATESDEMTEVSMAAVIKSGAVLKLDDGGGNEPDATSKVAADDCGKA